MRRERPGEIVAEPLARTERSARTAEDTGEATVSGHHKQTRKRSEKRSSGSPSDARRPRERPPWPRSRAELTVSRHCVEQSGQRAGGAASRLGP